jgi:hypothetical protein
MLSSPLCVRAAEHTSTSYLIQSPAYLADYRCQAINPDEIVQITSGLDLGRT